eukprot:scaffold7381_cov310-Pinguiococcus_pyrenoidosus.AAC.128
MSGPGRTEGRSMQAGPTLELLFRDPSGRAGSVMRRHGLGPEAQDVVFRLRQRLRMAVDLLDVLFLGSRQGHQRVLHAELVLPDDVQIVSQQQIVVCMDGAAQGVLDRQAGVVHLVVGKPMATTWGPKSARKAFSLYAPGSPMRLKNMSYLWREKLRIPQGNRACVTLVPHSRGLEAGASRHEGRQAPHHQHPESTAAQKQ